MMRNWLYHCNDCGSTNLEMDADIDPNATPLNEGLFRVPADCDEVFCIDCDSYVRFYTVSLEEEDLPE